MMHRSQKPFWGTFWPIKINWRKRGSDKIIWNVYHSTKRQELEKGHKTPSKTQKEKQVLLNTITFGVCTSCVVYNHLSEVWLKNILIAITWMTHKEKKKSCVSWAMRQKIRHEINQRSRWGISEKHISVCLSCQDLFFCIQSSHTASIL